jgi:hypothetical protein
MELSDLPSGNELRYLCIARWVTYVEFPSHSHIFCISHRCLLRCFVMKILVVRSIGCHSQDILYLQAPSVSHYRCRQTATPCVLPPLLHLLGSSGRSLALNTYRQESTLRDAKASLAWRIQESNQPNLPDTLCYCVRQSRPHHALEGEVS